MTDTIRKKHKLDREGLNPHILTWKLSALTISDVDRLFAALDARNDLLTLCEKQRDKTVEKNDELKKALDEARGKEKAAIHFARMFEKERDEARGKVDMLIDFMPEGWEMPLGWTQLVKQVKGGGDEKA